MPYYSDFSYSTPSSSYSLAGPYSTHSSLLSSNFSPSYTKPLPRHLRGGYKPHLTTISELNSPLRRVNSPKSVYHTKPSFSIRPIKVINTADIDVSKNRYRKFEKYDRPKTEAKEISLEKAPSPKRESPRNSLGEKEAKPNLTIRRDRPTVRLQTVHKDTLKNEIGAIKSWRDNFQPEELVVEAKRRKKTPGEILKEKFLIRSRSKENILNEPPKVSSSRKSVKKSPSFHDICEAITSDRVGDDLNPGQPVDIQRRQSRRLSSRNLIEEIRRSSTELSEEDLNLLNVILSQQNVISPVAEDSNASRDNVRKKKITKKKSSMLLLPSSNDNLDGEQAAPNSEVKSPSTREASKMKRTISNGMPSGAVDDEHTDSLKNAIYENAIRDISQVEIQQTKFKQKPVITATVEELEEPTTTLKAVVNDVEVEESPKMKKEKKFRFNVVVEATPQISYEKLPLVEIKNSVLLPKAKEPVITSILKKKPIQQMGVISNESKKVVKIVSSKKTDDIAIERNQRIAENGIKEIKSPNNIEMKRVGEFEINGPIDRKFSSTPIPKFTPLVNKVLTKKDNNSAPNLSNETMVQKEETNSAKIEPLLDKENRSAPTSLHRRLQKTVSDDSPCSKIELVVGSTNHSASSSQTSVSEKASISSDIKDDLTSDLSSKNTDSGTSKESSPSSSSTRNDTVSDKTNQSEVTSSIELSTSEEITDIKTALTDENDNILDGVDTTDKKAPSKRSLVQKANKDDPDLQVFEPPEPEPEPEPEPKDEKEVFVPLQSNRLSQWMHPWKKPEQFEECPVEIFARPKIIRGRHYPRPRGHPAPQPESAEEDEDSEEEDSSSEEESSTSSSDSSSGEEEDGGDTVNTKIGASTSSNDSGFGSGAPGNNKDCDVNIHKKCEKLTANLCGVNQKLVVEAIESVRKGSLDSRDSPDVKPSSNPAFSLDFGDLPEECSQSSTFSGFQKSGRITPPATTIPRFRKYCIDDFNFLKVLGKGSFGKVLLAELKSTEYYYAVKCLKKDVVLEDDDVECTLIERKVLALGTKHPYLCHLLCTFQTESHLFFVMEYLNGGDLMFHIQTSGRFPENQARFYGAEIVSGLKFLHNKGIVYRDLKLDNILLDFDGHVRIADFGMCKLQIFLDRMAETFCGTPDYMAPEIIKGQHYNQCVDWWSFGVLLYEMLLGQSPFSGCDEDELFWSICNEKPVLPRYLSTEATNILTLFLEKDASKRLGNRFSPHGDIQDQPFFRSIDWCALEARKLEAPFKPNLQHPLDTQYFDKHFTVEKAKLTPIETTILQSMDQSQFQGFSYTNPNATDK
ncbi:unnamed protein product [Phaedon cochleariae]|uniref:Uncharacterized protein n=1 Tax=Phaedon cochleariae TaxID=80249 RepID=A0A9P0DQP4_PHACE|nr:unnamed protein product [Phaedon cochleariae]